MNFEVNKGTLTIDGRPVLLPLPVDHAIEFAGRLFVALLDGNEPEAERQRVGNVACLDSAGRMLWRIKPTGLQIKLMNGSVVMVAWQALYLDPTRPDVLLLGDAGGYAWELDPETGETRNPVFVK